MVVSNDIHPLGSHFKKLAEPGPGSPANAVIYVPTAGGGSVYGFVTDKRGNPLPLVTKGYEHNQAVASATWVINHNLGMRPLIHCFLPSGVEFEDDIVHTSENQAIVNLAVATIGRARCL